MNVKVVGVMRNAQKNFASKSPANEVGLSWKLRRLSCCCSDYSRGLLLELHSIAIIIVIVERDLVSLASSETTTASLAVGRRVCAARAVREASLDAGRLVSLFVQTITARVASHPIRLSRRRARQHRLFRASEVSAATSPRPRTRGVHIAGFIGSPAAPAAR
eukprot:tig00021096_g18121.t1